MCEYFFGVCLCMNASWNGKMITTAFAIWIASKEKPYKKSGVNWIEISLVLEWNKDAEIEIYLEKNRRNTTTKWRSQLDSLYLSTITHRFLCRWWKYGLTKQKKLLISRLSAHIFPSFFFGSLSLDLYDPSVCISIFTVFVSFEFKHAWRLEVFAARARSDNLEFIFSSSAVSLTI